ncbi:class I SAM-dependent methyltransferase [Aspergillus saccharolyticus JOP 1030-1]|uniref:Velvet complex subunit laeA n=1 Tax=Aspergillus saccharolyticus JOP 1030-1 TaxID=1450539 RepID=A0A318ZQ83_9EURO|nr:S-adenosyl-L-methionine-dependent methyltransferase [Aspergillus saccharolyticus JOP 1030-1]PYH46573.1 S-adenosyl-L-methionine-dependent methyltransferase [Aspergillus saccharolyticus JOP 1030-1]
MALNTPERGIMAIKAIINTDQHNIQNTQHTYLENGRTYPRHNGSDYMLPCDEQEQDRLDMLHKVFLVVKGSANILLSPLPRTGRVLDLGCGTGIWALDMAKKYPNAIITGVDIMSTQPANCPPNCFFFSPFDYESPRALRAESWDLIHLQQGCGSVSCWPTLYKMVLDCLLPGGWFEQVEIDFQLQLTRRSKNATALQHWYHNIRRATELSGRPITHDSAKTIKQLYSTGFTEVRHICMMLPLNPWPRDEHLRKVGKWYSLALSESIVTLSLAPFSRVFRWRLDQIMDIVGKAKAEIVDEDLEGFNLLHVYMARKAT